MRISLERLVCSFNNLLLCVTLASLLAPRGHGNTFAAEGGHDLCSALECIDAFSHLAGQQILTA